MSTAGAAAKPAGGTSANPIVAWFAAQWWNLQMLLHSGFNFFPWVRPHWRLDKMADQRGRTIVVTGANSGTGYATASAYYARGARVLVLCRSAERAAQAIADMKRGGVANVLSQMEYSPVDETRAGTLEYIPCDLADLHSVSAAARAIAERVERVDVLFANAGIMGVSGRTRQGYPLQFGTNALGHQRLISLLLPLLRSPRPRPARVITVASAAHVTAPPGGIDYSALNPATAPNDRDPWLEYGESKWANIALAKHVHARWGPTCQGGVCCAPAPGEVLSIAVHPGCVATNLFMHIGTLAWLCHTFTPLLRVISLTAAEGALSQIWAAEVPDAEARELSGGYVWSYQERGVERADLHDPRDWERAWEWCEAQGARAE